MKYIVWFSWGLDSTYTAWKLKQQWHEVLLVNLKNTHWNNKCCSLPITLFEIAKELWLKLEIVNVTEDFKQLVIDNFIQTYLKGKTPNPCINCNEYVRFHALNEVRKKYGYDFVTTGHYAQCVNIDGNHYLSIPADAKKDQTYMIYRISNIVDKTDWSRILPYCDFLLTDIHKSEVKELAEIHNIPQKNADESQNICFIPDDDHKEFINQATGIKQKFGPIKTRYWEVVGEHTWVYNYTIWQRHWLELFNHKGQIYYVNWIDLESNTVFVGSQEELFHFTVELLQGFIHEELVKKHPNAELYWKVRYHWVLSKISKLRVEKESICIEFENAQRAPTPWQHCVIYIDINWQKVVLGWGVIK